MDLSIDFLASLGQLHKNFRKKEKVLTLPYQHEI